MRHRVPTADKRFVIAYLEATSKQRVARLCRSIVRRFARRCKDKGCLCRFRQGTLIAHRLHLDIDGIFGRRGQILKGIERRAFHRFILYIDILMVVHSYQPLRFVLPRVPRNSGAMRIGGIHPQIGRRQAGGFRRDKDVVHINRTVVVCLNKDILFAADGQTETRETVCFF